jgi:diguanylate cyclase (GGDEF)-like protein
MNLETNRLMDQGGQGSPFLRTLLIKFETSSENYCVINHVDEIQAISPQLVHFLEYSSSNELIGKKISSILKSPTPGELIDLSKTGGFFQNQPFICRSKTGKAIPITLDVRYIDPVQKINTSFPHFSEPIPPISRNNPSQDPTSITEAMQKITAAIYAKLNLSDLLDEILEQIGKVIAFDSASIALLEGDHFQLVAVKGFTDPDTVKKIIFPKQLSPDHLSPNLLSIQNRQSLQMGNVPQDYPLFVHPPDKTVMSWLVIPLLTKNSGIGTLNLDSYQANHFTDKDQEIAELFSAQAAIAIENAILYKQMESNAIYDSLTGLYNRRKFFSLAEKEFAQFHSKHYPISLVMLDLDNFKKINDTYGHLAGDEVLSTVAKLCLDCIRDEDIICRYGGDEMIILMPHITLDEAHQTAKKICETLTDRKYSFSETQPIISASIGISTILQTDTMMTAIARADKSLYLAKQSGRNQVVMITDESNQSKP